VRMRFKSGVSKVSGPLPAPAVLVERIMQKSGSVSQATNLFYALIVVLGPFLQGCSVRMRLVCVPSVQ
jgi:hypothetical protein